MNGGSPGEREVIIILGKSRYGKSTWLGKFLVNKPSRFIFDPFRKQAASYFDAETLIEKHDNGDFQRPPYSVGSSAVEDVDLLSSIAFLNGNARTRPYFIIEECAIAFYKGERISDALQEAIFLGGHNWLSIVLVAQRAASIPIELRSQATRFVTFLQTEKKDIEWCRDYLGERFDELRTLAKGECLDWENDSVSRYSIFLNGN